ncbi:MAG: cell envelope biogenesis protein OmpA, partial [Pseudomonadota bacterium]
MALATATAFSTFGLGAAANTVTLESFDNSIKLSGELLEFDGTNYRVKSMIGEILIDASRVKCTGDGCPEPELLTSEFAIS